MLPNNSLEIFFLCVYRNKIDAPMAPELTCHFLRKVQEIVALSFSWCYSLNME